jgi:FAD synthase
MGFTLGISVFWLWPNAVPGRLNGDVLAVAFDRPPRLFFPPLPSLRLISLTSPAEKEACFGVLAPIGLKRSRFFKIPGRIKQRINFFSGSCENRWNASEIVVGFNFRFGKGREGDVDSLAQLWEIRGGTGSFGGPGSRSEGVISSGRVRPLIGEGRLGNPRSFWATTIRWTAPVVRGRGVGRRLGYPTANLDVGEDKILPSGVFAVTLTLPTGVDRTGLLNVGCPSHVSKTAVPQRSVEVHILDFSGDLSGRQVDLFFIKKLRDEKKFSVHLSKHWWRRSVLMRLSLGAF